MQGTPEHWKVVKDCCKEHLQPYDCGCSFGCDTCYASFQCSVCNELYTRKQANAILDGTCVPPRKLIEREQAIYDGLKTMDRPGRRKFRHRSETVRHAAIRLAREAPDADIKTIVDRAEPLPPYRKQR